MHSQKFSNPDQLWSEQKDVDGTHGTWYKKAVSYWDGQEPSYNGVLGGFGFVSDMDVNDSRQLLEKALKDQFGAQASGRRPLVAIGKSRVAWSRVSKFDLDCGAGVGRVTNELLLHHFDEVDLLEPSRPLLECAQKNLGSGSKSLSRKVPSGHRAVNFYLAGLEQHVFEPGRYDCIWIQWCLLYLTDADMQDMFQRAAAGLKPDGLIFVKENVCKEGFIVDNDDSSLTRSNAYMLELFQRSNMQLLQSAKQKNFPKDLFDVRMYVLRPRRD